MLESSSCGLEELCGRIERHWGVHFTLHADEGLGSLPRELARDIHQMVHEAVVNSARHGPATAVEVRVGVEGRKVRIVVTDNGRGFPFFGHRGHVLLSVDGGPTTLWSRVEALGGALTVDSTEEGVRLEIVLPLERDGEGDREEDT